MITLVSTLFSIALRSFFRPFAKKETKRKSRTVSEDFDNTMSIFHQLNMAHLKYGSNTHECAKRMVCVVVKKAVIQRKLKGKRASHINRIIEGLSRYVNFKI